MTSEKIKKRVQELDNKVFDGEVNSGDAADEVVEMFLGKEDVNRI